MSKISITVGKKARKRKKVFIEPIKPNPGLKAAVLELLDRHEPRNGGKKTGSISLHSSSALISSFALFIAILVIPSIASSVVRFFATSKFARLSANRIANLASTIARTICFFIFSTFRSFQFRSAIYVK